MEAMESIETIEIGKKHLSDFQKEILNECLVKKSGGLSLTMGSGKTIISIVLALEQTKITKQPILIVVSKTLVESWVSEIKKFFNDSLKYIVFHSNYIKSMNDYVFDENINLIITTPEVLSKYYKLENIEDKFIKKEIINQGRFNQHVINVYNIPLQPYTLNKLGGSFLYSTIWGCLIVDEVQNFTKVSTLKCQSIASLCAKNRWALSGTMFNEPNPERILGYYLIINDQKFPRTLPYATALIRSTLFQGFNSSLVCRKENPSFIKPKINQRIVAHNLSAEEEKLYMTMKVIMMTVNKKVKEYKMIGDDTNARRFGTYLLAMICYLRQCVICSIIPIATVAIDMTDFQNKSSLSDMLSKEIKLQNLDKWFEDIESVKSSRFRETLKIINSHKNENIVIFSCFRTVIDIFRTFLPSDRKIFTISSTMTTKKRAQILEKFSEISENGLGHILLLTYDIGSEGLNLQVANTVILLDYYWNDGKTSQSVARVLRYGQKSKEVNIYYLTSNTAIEKAIFEKQDVKLRMINELETGRVQTTIKRIQVKDIINIINNEHNINAIHNIYKKRHSII